MLGVLREQLPFKEVPIKLYFRSREDSGKEADRDDRELLESGDALDNDADAS